MYTRSTTGLDARTAGMLCYALGMVSGLIFLAVEKKSRFVMFHALQSTLLFVMLFIIHFVFGFIPFLGWLGSLLLTPVALVAWVMCMVLALQGKKFKLPLIGDIAERESSLF